MQAVKGTQEIKVTVPEGMTSAQLQKYAKSALRGRLADRATYNAFMAIKVKYADDWREILNAERQKVGLEPVK